MTKKEAIARLEIIKSNSALPENLEIVAKDWEGYGKSRTYLSMVETCKNSTKYKVKKYGYIDNSTSEYIPEKYGDITKNTNFGGNAF